MSLCIGLVLNGLLCAPAYGQEVLGGESTRRPAPPPLLPEEKPFEPPSRQVLPELPPVLPPPEREVERLPVPRVFIREIRVSGSTILSPEELAEVVAPYVNREVTSEDLEALRLSLTRYYISRGFINSGAVIPDQRVVGGVITLHIMEGELTRIELEGNKWYRNRYLRSRLALGARPPLNINALQERLQLLQQDYRIQRLNAELKPGVRPGESVLRVQVAEEMPIKAWFGFDNYQSPTVGAERGRASVAHHNLTGHGDVLSVTYGRSDGIDLQLEASYSIPLTARDTTLAMWFEKNNFAVVEEPFAPLDIDSESEIYGIAIRQPIYRTLKQEFAISLAGEHLHNETFLLGEPFSFSPGAEDGESTVTALRFAQEWIYRTQTQVFAARSRFTFGLDALGATNNASSLPDGRFFAWLGQFQWARRLGPWDIQLVFRTDLQLADDSLLPVEQVAIGGRYTVRGYRENQLVRDNGLIGSVEFRIPLFRDKPWADFVQLVPFVDYGRAWNTTLSTPHPKEIASIGLGLRWAATFRYPIPWKPQLEIYWGAPLREVDNPGGNLQDHGIHLQFVIAVL